MPVAGGGFEQCYNAQAVVAAGSLLVVAADVVQAPNDKQQLEPMLSKIGALPDELGKAETLLADNGYFSEANVLACTAAGIDPLIAMGRQSHYPSLAERFAAAPPAPENPTPVEAMAHRLKTPEGKKLYALRKQTPEPVFGIIKSALGFRQFLLRGLDNVRGEWSLVTMAWNMKRMFALAPHPEARRAPSALGLGALSYPGTGEPSRDTGSNPRNRTGDPTAHSPTRPLAMPLRQAARELQDFCDGLSEARQPADLTPEGNPAPDR